MLLSHLQCKYLIGAGWNYNGGCFILAPSVVTYGGFRRWRFSSCVCICLLCLGGVVSPSASSIFGMSRNFSATSKAVFRLPMGSSCRETRFCWAANKVHVCFLPFSNFEKGRKRNKGNKSLNASVYTLVFCTIRAVLWGNKVKEWSRIEGGRKDRAPFSVWSSQWGQVCVCEWEHTEPGRPSNWATAESKEAEWERRWNKTRSEDYKKEENMKKENWKKRKNKLLTWCGSSAHSRSCRGQSSSGTTATDPPWQRSLNRWR